MKTLNLLLLLFALFAIAMQASGQNNTVYGTGGGALGSTNSNFGYEAGNAGSSNTLLIGNAEAFKKALGPARQWAEQIKAVSMKGRTPTFTPFQVGTFYRLAFIRTTVRGGPRYSR